MNGTIGSRLREVRACLGYTSARMAEFVGLKTRKSWEDSERGKRFPAGEELLRLAEKGFDTNWILTGRGRMKAGLDEEAMAAAIQAIEEGFGAQGVTPSFRQKAALICTVYRVMLDRAVSQPAGAGHSAKPEPSAG